MNDREMIWYLMKYYEKWVMLCEKGGLMHLPTKYWLISPCAVLSGWFWSKLNARFFAWQRAYLNPGSVIIRFRIPQPLFKAIGSGPASPVMAGSYFRPIMKNCPLTLSQTSPGFYVPAVQVFWKHCGKRLNCSLRTISPFPTVFSTRLKNFLPFLSNLKLSSAKSFSLEESKICCLGKS